MNPSVDPYVEWMQAQGLRPRTVEQRAYFADARLREWGRWDISTRDLAQWLGQFSGWTALTYHGHATSLYRWLVESGQLDASPIEAIRRPPKPRPDPRPLTRDEVELVFDGAEGDVRAWMMLALLAGLRAHEIAKFRGQDMDARMIRVVGKGGQFATVPTHPELWELSRDFPSRGYWFPSPVREGQPIVPSLISAKIGKRFRAVGIQSGSIHRLRATYGTELVRKGVSLRVVQTLMRHSSLATTEYYLGVDEDERAAAIRLLAA